MATEHSIALSRKWLRGFGIAAYSLILIGASWLWGMTYSDRGNQEWERLRGVSHNADIVQERLVFYSTSACNTKTGCYPTSLKVEDPRATVGLLKGLLNPYTQEMVKQVPWGQYSAGDFSYWVSADGDALCLLGYGGRGFLNDQSGVASFTQAYGGSWKPHDEQDHCPAYSDPVTKRTIIPPPPMTPTSNLPGR